MNTMDISAIAPKLRGDIQSAIRREVLDICKKALRKNVMNTLYSGKSPTYYDRTYDVLNAVDIKDVSIGRSVATFTITIDASKMRLINPASNAPFGRWGKHVGFSGQDFREGLIEILDEGGGSRYYMHEANHFFDKTENDLDDDIPTTLVKALRSNGWDAQLE